MRRHGFTLHLIQTGSFTSAPKISLAAVPLSTLCVSWKASTAQQKSGANQEWPCCLPFAISSWLRSPRSSYRVESKSELGLTRNVYKNFKSVFMYIKLEWPLYHHLTESIDDVHQALAELRVYETSGTSSAFVVSNRCVERTENS